MKGRSTLVIFISIIVLGIFIWAQDSWLSKKAVRDVQRVRLFNFDPATLMSIEFGHSNGVVRCEKENGIWMVGGPEENMGRADVDLIQRMIGGLNSMGGKGTTITEKQLSIRGIDSSEYGFSDPFVTITAVDNRGRQTWLIGRETALGEMVYAKAEPGENIYTVSEQLLRIIPFSPDILRDRMLFPGEATGVRRVEIRGSAGFMQLVKDSQQGWRLQQPIAAQADTKEVKLFIDQLYQFRIKEFIADDVSDFSIYGLQGETRQISLGMADGTSRMLIIGDVIPDDPESVFARRADDTSVFSLAADILQLVNVPAEGFRNANVLAVPPGSITSIAITRGEEKLDMAYSVDKGWNITTPVAWEADPKAISDFVTLWVAAVVTEFDVVTNNIPEEWAIEFGAAELGITNRLELLPTRGSKEGLLLRRDDDPAVYRINLPVVPDGIINPLAYKNRSIWKLNPELINALKLLKAGKGFQQIERLDDRSFTAIGTNENVRVNDEALSRLMRRLQRVDTAGYITYNPRDLDIYGLAEPSAELYISLSDTNQLGQVLLVGRETSEGFYSMLKGRDVIFYLEKPVVDILTADLLQTSNPITPAPE